MQWYRASKCNNTKSANTIIRNQEKEQKATIQSQEMQQYKTSKYNYTELGKSDTEPAKCNNP